MRDNSGKGGSNSGLLDPTTKDREAEKGRSGQAPLHPSKDTPKERGSQPDGSGGGGR